MSMFTIYYLLAGLAVLIVERLRGITSPLWLELMIVLFWPICIVGASGVWLFDMYHWLKRRSKRGSIDSYIEALEKDLKDNND